MKKFIVMCVLMLLWGCASQPPQSVSARPMDNESAAFGSLSDATNPADVAASVVYTRLAAYRYRAAQLLRHKKITVAAAIHVQRRADTIRAELDRAFKAGNIPKINALGQQLSAAETELQVTP